MKRYLKHMVSNTIEEYQPGQVLVHLVLEGKVSELRELLDAIEEQICKEIENE
tara:strand:+ start:982 stop:1140 length:159 start_codon:yes stop_codon:yes gene_type:complete